ncbi:MAG: glycosyltransferase [Xanthobacteraceae bacterium]
MAGPLIAIVTPTKNRRMLLAETIDSVQRQTLEAWEHIIVDDGSDDGTSEDVSRRAEGDSRIRYVTRAGERSGANVCRNQGLAAATADLVVFLDSDDVLEPECLARRVEIMRRNIDLDFVVCAMGAFLKAPGDLNYKLRPDVLGDDFLAFLFFDLPWQTTGPTWRRQTLERLGGFDEQLPSWQDVDLHVRALAAGCRYLRFSEVDFHMRWQFEETKVSIQQRRSPGHLKAAERLLVKFEHVVREGPGMTWTRQRALCSLYFFVAECWLNRGDLSAALAAWRGIRTRRLGPQFLHWTGIALLIAQAFGPSRRLGQRVAHKWKGWMRLRTNPELVGGKK